MTHEVYISYDDEDKLAADAIVHALEENEIKCWIRSRDGKENEEDVNDALVKSKVMVVVYSTNAKDSNQVYSDSNIAFGEEIPICVFNIDNSKLSGGLEFYLNSAKHWLDIFPKPEYEFRELIMDVAIILDKPIEDPLISAYVKNFIDNLDIEDEEKKKRRIILLLIFTIFVPLILIAISFATFDISGNVGTLLFLLAIAFFIGSPVFYLVYNYMMK